MLRASAHRRIRGRGWPEEAAGNARARSAAASGPEPCRDLDSALLALAGCRRGAGAARPRPRSSTRTGSSSGPTGWFEALGRDGRRPRRSLNRRDAEADANVAAMRVARVRLPRRRLAAAPALGAEGQRALRRDRSTRYGSGAVHRGVGRGRDRARATRWSTRAAARTPSASASCRGLAVFPYHGGAADHLRERSSSSCPRTRCSSGSTSRPRSCATRDGQWQRRSGAGTATVYRKGDEPTVLRDRRIRRRSRRCLALGDRDLEEVQRDRRWPVAGAAIRRERRDLLRVLEPRGDRAERRVVGRQRRATARRSRRRTASRPCRAGSLPVFAARERARPGSRPSGSLGRRPSSRARRCRSPVGSPPWITKSFDDAVPRRARRRSPCFARNTKLFDASSGASFASSATSTSPQVVESVAV